jgi:hypothetical protein
VSEVAGGAVVTAGALALMISRQLLQSGADAVEAVAALRIALRQGEDALRRSGNVWALPAVDRMEREFWDAARAEDAKGEPS